MEKRAFGKTGLTVSALGFGAGHIGGADMSEEACARLLNGALDAGITLFDTARSYGLAEERIGRHLSHRRHEIVLSTKGGYTVEGVGDWTGAAITQSIEQSLARMRTDHLDIFHLHSCALATLSRAEILDALRAAKQSGKVRVIAYSGDNLPLDFTVDELPLGSVQCSVSIFDQRAISGAIARAGERGLGVIGKRPLGNSPWRFSARPIGDYSEVYWERMQAMHLPIPDPEWPRVALAFSAFAPHVSSVIVGTKNLTHLAANIAALEAGPLSPALVAQISATFSAHDRDWHGET